MRTLYLGFLTFAVGLSLSAVVPAQQPPAIVIPGVDEMVSKFEAEASKIREQGKQEQEAAKAEVLKQLQALQDRLVREARLDEAIAVRERIKVIQGVPAPVVAAPVANPRSIFPKVPRLQPRTSAPTVLMPLLEEGAKLVEDYRIKSRDIEESSREKVRLLGLDAAKPLQSIFEKYCQEAKLDEALAARSAIQKVTLAFITPLPDPGVPNFEVYEIGRVLYYETVGTVVGNVRGTDVYTVDSLLAAAAVHAGVLGPGEKGIVKVTVMPAQFEFLGSDRNGVSSIESGELPVAFRVDKVTAASENPETQPAETQTSLPAATTTDAAPVPSENAGK